MAATSREIAEAAIAAITVEYEDLPAVFDVDEALLPEGAPLVHETDAKGEPVKDNRLRLPWKFNHGDVEAGEAASAFVVEGEYETGWVTHICMGTSGCVASFDTDENLTMYSVTQIPSLAKADFHEALKTWGIPGNVRVVNTVVGGGFGSKLDTYAFEYIAILLAHRTRRPVKILFDREEEFVATSPRQPVQDEDPPGLRRRGAPDLPRRHLPARQRRLHVVGRDHAQRGHDAGGQPVPGAERALQGDLRLHEQHLLPGDARLRHAPDHLRPRVQHGRARREGRHRPLRAAPAQRQPLGRGDAPGLPGHHLRPQGVLGGGRRRASGGRRSGRRAAGGGQPPAAATAGRRRDAPPRSAAWAWPA